MKPLVEISDAGIKIYTTSIKDGKEKINIVPYEFICNGSKLYSENSNKYWAHYGIDIWFLLEGYK